MHQQTAGDPGARPGEPGTFGTARPVGRRFDVVFALILLVALHYRVDLATIRPYIHDEANTSIPLARTISFEPGRLHLPIRGENHGALPAYVVKASSALFGTSRVGRRALHGLLSLCTIVLVYALVRQRYGPVAARWAAALLAFNEYYAAVSARATAHVPYLFFATTAMYAFSRFLAVERAAYLYLAGLSVGVAFYAKEHAALLLPVFALTLLHPRYRHWWRTPHVVLAAVIFLLVVAPDLAWNLTTNRETARVAYGAQRSGYATYSSHLERIGGIGFSPYPAMFYARDAVQSLNVVIAGRELPDDTPEYPSMNSVLGALLLAAVLVTAVRLGARPSVDLFLLIAFGLVFGFFTAIEKGNPPGRLDPVSWIWVEMTMIPAVILAGARLADATGTLRIATWAVAVASLLYACVRAYA